jgi:class 3 adenylate cyclase/tetratricopeptide (TPR) repeat protein
MQCPSCTTENPDAARFCHQCGAALAAPRDREGERKQATVLFADVVGSTAAAEHLDPEAWTECMNGAFAFMIEAVTHYGGTIGRLMGDGVLALFGAPVAHEDDAERAVLAALRIRAAALGYAEEVERRHGLAFAVRVGVNTGLSVLTVVGDGANAEYTAMGDAVNLAARLQALAEPNTVLIGPETFDRVRHRFEVEPRGATVVRGRSAAVELFRVTGVRTGSGRRRGSDDAAPLVGRDRERRLSERRLDDLRGGRGGILVVVGEAGVGKSRLVAELAARATDASMRWLEGRGVSYADAVPYHPWRQVLLAAIGADDAEPGAALRRRLAEATMGGPVEPEDRPYLELVLGIDAAGERDRWGTGDEIVERIGRAVLRCVTAWATAAPTVLVFDDLHWADGATVALIDAVSRAVHDVPLLLVLEARPIRESPAWPLLERIGAMPGDRATTIGLQPLDTTDAGELLDHLLGVDALAEATRALILRKTDGNPLFLEEVVRSLIDTGQVVRDGSAWRVAVPIDDVAVPESLAGLLGARIDRLPRGARRIALTASVVGRTFAHAVLAAVVAEGPPEERPADVARSLAILADHGLVVDAEEAERASTFRHALIHDAAYGRLLLRRRRALHELVGRVLERLHGDRLDEVAPTLGSHFARAEAWVEAARYGLIAADRARRLHATADALDQYERVLHALDRASDAPAEMRVDALLGWADAALQARHHERPELRGTLLARLEAAVDRARGLSPQRRLVLALVALGNALSLSGYPGTGFAPLLEAHDLARALGDDELFLLPYWAATERLIDHDPRAAATQFADVVAMARRARNRGIEAHALGSQAVALARLGEFEAARAAIDGALEAVADSGSIIKLADVNILAGATFLEMGDLEPGLAYSRVGAELALSVEGLECASGGLHVMGQGKIEARQLAEACDDLTRSIELGRLTQMRGVLHQIEAALATARFLEGDVRAVEGLERALQDAQRVDDVYGVAIIADRLAAMELRLGRPEGALAHLEPALAFYRDRGMMPALARGLERTAEARLALGQLEEAAVARLEAARIAARTTAVGAAPAHPRGDGSASPGVRAGEA